MSSVEPSNSDDLSLNKEDTPKVEPEQLLHTATEQQPTVTTPEQTQQFAAEPTQQEDTEDNQLCEVIAEDKNKPAPIAPCQHPCCENQTQ